jgi:trimeric autotransporter adhesin
MKKYLIFYSSIAACVLFAGPLKAQFTGALSYHAPRKWQGVDLKQFFGSNSNSSFGASALGSCTSCVYNVAAGWFAAYSCTTCVYTVAVGVSAAYFSNASNSVAVGSSALELGESFSTAVGYLAMKNSHSATGYNTAVGTQALFGDPSGSTGTYNTALGAIALLNNSTGSDNVAVGYEALYSNTTGNYNNASGLVCLYSNTTGNGNVGDGLGSLNSNTSGSNNTGIGFSSMTTNTTGTYNTGLGYGANVGSGALTNATALGFDAVVSSSNQVVIGSTAVTSIGGYAPWSKFSDGRFKKNIQPNVPGLAFINKLSPVTYTLDVAGIEARLHRNEPAMHGGGGMDVGKNVQDDPVMKQAMQEKAAIIETGFIAQDVEKAASAVGYAFSGVDKPKDAEQSFYGLRYSDFVPPLVKSVQELSAANDSKDSVINALQTQVDSVQTQINELRALVMGQKSALSGASLDQNAPNPFNGSTVIGYSLPAGVSSAQLQITDATGKIVSTIPLSGSGRSSVTADAAGLASGTYQYSLVVNGKLVSTKQMVLVR